jgi:putative transposase
MLQLLVDAEATAFIGAEPNQRTEARTNMRNGTREKLIATATGDITVKIPKVRSGSFIPSLLAPRRRVNVALHAVVMQAWIEGVSTRKVAFPADRRTARAASCGAGTAIQGQLVSSGCPARRQSCR